jgi:hypothetical protein
LNQAAAVGDDVVAWQQQLATAIQDPGNDSVQVGTSLMYMSALRMEGITIQDVQGWQAGMNTGFGELR